MRKFLNASLAALISASLLLSGCGSKFTPSQQEEKPGQAEPQQVESKQTESPQTSDGQKPQTPGDSNGDKSQEPKAEIDLAKVKPNENGKIMVVMFHNFIEEYKSGDKEYTTTFDAFGKLLVQLYDKGYRLINVNDYLSNNISVPAGCIPMIFTFDDGTPGQFNFIEENGKLVVNPKSAVGIMEEFNKAHPDFGLKGTFYVNLGLQTFEGKGTVAERLQYLREKGFEIGNHTLTHVSLPQVKSADKVKQEVGGNQKKMLELIPGYNFTSLALPYGQVSKDLQEHVFKGEFEGVKYENNAVMLVGAGPTLSPVSKKFNPLATARVRASGIKPVECDLAWWVEKLSRDEQYISDGDAETVTIPKAKEVDVDAEKLKGKKLVTY